MKRFRAIFRYAEDAYTITRNTHDRVSPFIEGAVLHRTGIEHVYINYPFKDRREFFPFNEIIYRIEGNTMAMQYKNNTNTFTICFDNTDLAAKWQLALMKNTPPQMSCNNNGNGNVIIFGNVHSSQIK